MIGTVGVAFEILKTNSKGAKKKYLLAEEFCWPYGPHFELKVAEKGPKNIC